MLESQKMTAPIKPKIGQNKFNNKSQYLLSYLQKQKLKMEKPLNPKFPLWDDIFWFYIQKYFLAFIVIIDIIDLLIILNFHN